MKRLLITLCCLPTFALATETGESCGQIEDNIKRLECYDSIFIMNIYIVSLNKILLYKSNTYIPQIYLISETLPFFPKLIF